MGLSKLAEEFDLSIYYISKVFKDNMDIGFKDKNVGIVNALMI